MDQDPFKEYLRQTEPSKRDKGYAWNTAIGLQAVDGLKPSKYLVETAIQNIEGKITIEEAQRLLDSYYEENPKAVEAGDRTEEADKVSVRITKLLSEKAFSFTPNEYLSIHKKLFTGIYSHAGKLRDYNITKKEWVLNGATVLYGSASELRATLEYDLSQDRSLGFEATNDIFAENAWYFRNALVRANYNDLKNGIHETTEFLELFLRNLLFDEQNELHNRAMHISGLFSDHIKADIEKEKTDIEKEKADIEMWNEYENLLFPFSSKTAEHIQKMYESFGKHTIFGRGDVQVVTGLKHTRASEIINILTEANVIEPVSGHGKGKYRFSRHTSPLK